ncbi:unnamed protein product [Ectocarpus sp. 4 AP-2014]
MGGTQSSTQDDDGGGVRGSRGERTRTNSRDDDAPATAAAPAPAPPTPSPTSSPSSSSSSGGAAGEEQQRELAELRQRLLRPASRVPPAARVEHEKDHALVLDLMEFFCYSVKPDPSFSGSMTFVFDQELDEDMEDGSWDGVARDKPELELSVTVEKVREDDEKNGEAGNLPRNRRPRVLVTRGGPPVGAGEAKGRVRVPYKHFLLMYSGKATAKDIVRLAMRRTVELTGFAAFMQFGLSFDYSSDTWQGYYDIKASLGAASAAPGGEEGLSDEPVDTLGSADTNSIGCGGDDGEGGQGGDCGSTSSSAYPSVLFSSDGFRELEAIEEEATRREQELLGGARDREERGGAMSTARIRAVETAAEAAEGE